MKPLAALFPGIDPTWRAYLLAIILAAALPLTVLTGYRIVTDARDQHQRTQRELQQTAQSLARAVEGELASSIDALTLLAGTAALQGRGHAGLAGAVHALRPRLPPAWLGAYLADRRGKLLFVTSTAPGGDTAKRGQSAPPTVAPPPFPSDAMAPFSSSPARISGLVASPAPGQSAVAIDVPITLGGNPGYRLGAWIATPVWAEFLRQAGMPAGAVASLYDRDRRLIAQTGPAGGQGATYNAWGAIARAGWGIDVAIPAAPLDARRNQATLAALATGAACLFLGILLALVPARRLQPAGERAEARLASAEKELRESQRLIDLAQEAGHIGFFHYLFDTDALRWTPGLSRLLGLEAIHRESAWAQFLEHIASEHRGRVENALQRAYALGQEKETLEFRVALPGGTWRWLSCRILVNYGEAGRPLQMIGVALDITDQKEAEQGRAALTRREHAARVEAEAANRAKDEFLAMLGHELRNPLSAIAAAIEVLNRVDADAESAVSARAIIARQTRHLARLMDDLLDVARVISGKILLARQSIDLAPLVERLVAMARLTGAADRHQLNNALKDVWIDADATRIEQVVNNLLTNALKYTPAGGCIDVEVGSEGDQAVLKVRDTGVGIPPALLPKIFDLFVQSERTAHRRAGGLGIGLTLVRRLVELHGGTVTAASSAAGTEFTVRLPAIDAPAGIPAHPGVPPSRRRRVGLIEDNQDALSTLHQMLELDGHTVWCASDGIQGLASLLESRPDVAVVDIGLPGLNGLEVARRSRAAGYAGRMIALSGYGRDNDGEEALAAGFDAYLVKPVDADRLRRILADD